MKNEEAIRSRIEALEKAKSMFICPPILLNSSGDYVEQRFSDLLAPVIAELATLHWVLDEKRDNT